MYNTAIWRNPLYNERMYRATDVFLKSHKR